MSSPTMNKEYPNNSQRAAICFSQWENRRKRKTSKASEIEWDEENIDGIIDITKKK